MKPQSAILALAALVSLPACLGARPKAFSIDPEPRGFVLPERPVILFYVDGLRADVLQELADSGQLPRLQRLLFDRGTRVRSAVTCVPSVTYDNAVSMLTGCWPSTHGAWSNVAFDRDQLVMLTYDSLGAHKADDVRSDSMFELLDGELTAGIGLPFQRGVKLSRVQSIDDGGIEFGADWIMGRKQAADDSMVEQLEEIADAARRIGQWPAFIAVYVPATDEIGHLEGSDSAEYRDTVANLDEAIGQVLEAFEAQGMLDELTVVLTSDHGHHPTPWFFDLQPFLSAALGMPVVIGEASDAQTPYVERWERYAPARAVIVPNGYREASVHLRAGESWGERPGFEQIMAMPGAAGVDATAAAPSHAPPQRLPDQLLMSAAISVVAVRAGEHEVRVYSGRGAAAIRRTSAQADDPLFAYEVLEGSDPLLYDSTAALAGWMQSPHTSREWLEATADTSRPDVVPQLLTAFDDPRSGDVILFAAPGWDFSPDYVGGHGGLEREELIVPLYLAGPGIAAGGELPFARLVDVVPTLIELTGAPHDGTSFDGKSLARELGSAGRAPPRVARNFQP